MTLYMLDTNAASSLIADPRGRVAEEVARAGFENVSISAIVSAELEYGIAWKRDGARTTQARDFLRSVTITPFDRPADRFYGELRAALRSRGTPIGPNDLLIAAHALALDATLVTDNMGEFSRVPGLAVENWLRERPTSP